MEISYTYKSDIQDIPQIRKDISSLASSWKIPEPEHRQIKVIIEELFSNIVRYGYNDSAEHLIDLKISMEDQKVTIQIVDDGMPFDPTGYHPSQELDPVRSVSEGMGLVLIMTFSDSLNYHREDQKNHLEITKRIKSNSIV